MPNFESSTEDLPSSRLQKTKTFFETLESGTVGQPAPHEREGLPPSYRMRAEPHYVDLLSSRTSSARDEQVARSAENLVPATTIAPFSSEAASALHAGHELTQSLNTLAACAGLLTGAHSELSKAVVGNLIRAEVWRAATLLWATRVLRHELPLAKGATAVRGVVDRATEEFGPERQVRAISVDSQADLPHGAFVAADQEMLVGALSCAMLATLPLLDAVKDPRLSIAAAEAPAGQVTFTVSQQVIVPPERWSARAFDPHWTERPGGTTATIALLAVERVASLHGGTATVTTADRGTKIAISIPTGL